MYKRKSGIYLSLLVLEQDLKKLSVRNQACFFLELDRVGFYLVYLVLKAYGVQSIVTSSKYA